MPFLCLVLVDLGIVISINPQLFQFIEVYHSLLSSFLVVKVDLLYSPKCVMFKFKMVVAGLSKNHRVWRHANRSLGFPKISVFGPIGRLLKKLSYRPIMHHQI